MASTDQGNADVAGKGPVLIAYDGSELAEAALTQAGSQLAPGREALVLCVWQTSDLGFVPVGRENINAAAADEVRQAAEETAAHGAALANKAGFQAQSLAIEGAPTWKGIVQVAKEHDASLIVLGPHRRTGIVGQLLGSVSAAVVAHAPTSVLVVYQPS